MLAARSDGTDDEIILRAVAAKQRAEAGQHGYEEAGVLAICQFVKTLGQALRKPESMHGSAKTLQGRARMICRQLEHRNLAVELGRPELSRLVTLILLEGITLPL